MMILPRCSTDDLRQQHVVHFFGKISHMDRLIRYKGCPCPFPWLLTGLDALFKQICLTSHFIIRNTEAKTAVLVCVCVQTVAVLLAYIFFSPQCMQCAGMKRGRQTHGRSSRRKKQAALEESFRQKCSEYAIQFSLTLCLSPLCMYVLQYYSSNKDLQFGEHFVLSVVVSQSK